jgi:cytosine/adenosine deaminase-related metal-dependent hydrolase
MRSKIQCGWLVGYSGNGHVLWHDAELVYEGTQILFVGERFDGTVDTVIDARAKLVVPGFIDTHVHSGHRASHRLISDVGRPDYFGQPFFEISVPRAGTRVGGDPRYARPDDTAAAGELLLNARFTVAELLRNGITTFVEFGSQLQVQQALDAQIGELGIRAYLGPGFDSGRWIGGPDGRLTRVVDEAAGEREFALALDFIERRAGAHGGRLRGILVPREVETCTPALLRAAAREAKARGLPVAIHAAYNIHEFFDIIREHQKTSIELLLDVGLMSSTLNIGHGNFVAENPLMNYSGGRDLEIMGGDGCTVSHCPVNIARRARFLDSWERYRKAGVNIARHRHLSARHDHADADRVLFWQGREPQPASGLRRRGIFGRHSRRRAFARARGSRPAHARGQGRHCYHRPRRPRLAALRTGAGPDQEPGRMRHRRRCRHGHRRRRRPSRRRPYPGGRCRRVARPGANRRRAHLERLGQLGPARAQRRRDVPVRVSARQLT